MNIMNVASPNNSGATLLSIVDRDDNTAPTTLLELQQYSNCQCISVYDSQDIIFEPSYTSPVFAGGVFSGYQVVTDPTAWLDCAQASIPYYGIKIGISALAASTTSKLDWDVEAWYQVSFKDPR